MLFRKAIFIIHGFAGGVWDHQNLANELQMYLDFDVYMITLPGHDKSIMTNVKRDDWIRAVENQVEKLIARGYNKIYVVGHSMGGVLASHVASKYKEVKRLVLVAPAFRYLIFKDDKLQVLGSIKEMPKILKQYNQKDVISRIIKMPLPVTMEFINLVKEHTNDVKSINCPTLIIHGNDDQIVPKSSVDYVHRNLKSDVNILVNMDDVTHDVFNGSRGDEAIDLTIRFLRMKFYKKIKEEINK